MQSVSDKLPPTATCPLGDVGIVSGGHLVKVHFPEPTFDGQHTVTMNYKSGIVQNVHSERPVE